MEGDTLIDSDSGSFDSFTFLPTGLAIDTRLSKKRPRDSAVNIAPSSGTAASPPQPPPSALAKTLRGDKDSNNSSKKKRKVSFMIEAEDDAKAPAVEMAMPSSQPGDGDKKLSAEEIEEMKRKTEHWWSLPADTTQEEFDYAFDHFKEGRYFEVHMDVEWMDVQIQLACARLLSQDQFSDATQVLCGEIHAAMTRNDAEQVAALARGDPELIRLTRQFKESSAEMLVERQKLTDKFGMIHSAKIAIKSEVYVCSATRLRQAGKEVTDKAVEEELAAFERGEITVPGSQPQGGCIMAQGYRGPHTGASIGVCPIRPDSTESDQPQPPQSPPPPSPRTEEGHRPPSATVCPFTGRKAPTSGERGLQTREEEEEPSLVVAPPLMAAASGVCPYTGHKASTSGDVGVQAREEDDPSGE